MAGGSININYQLTPWVKRLLIANIVVFVLTSIGDERLIFRWFSFQSSEVLFRPWGAVTYMFLHGDFWHLFMNMLVLFFFGPPLESKWASSVFVKYYIICGLGGVALSFFFDTYPIIGASAAVYGIMLAFAITWPEAPIYVWGIFPVKAKWLMAFLFVVTFSSAFGEAGDGVAHFAHLGGLITGLLYLKTDWKISSQIKKFIRIKWGRFLSIFIRDKTENSYSTLFRADNSKIDAKEKAMLDAVDVVLDKISAEGISSLTETERKLLDEVSRKHRTN